MRDETLTNSGAHGTPATASDEHSIASADGSGSGTAAGRPAARIRWLRRLGLWAGPVLAALGTLVVVAWTMGAPQLTTTGVGTGTVKVSTGVGFILAGAALWLQRGSAPERRLASVSAVAVSGVGAVTLGWYAAFPTVEIPLFLRMSPQTSAGFALGGLALLLVVGRDARRVAAGQFLMVPVAVVALLSLVGHAYGVPSFYSVVPHTQMTVTTAVGFAILAGAALAASPDRGPVTVFMAETAASAMARRLLPVAIALPLALGYARLLGQRMGLYDTAYGVALFTVANVLALVGVIYATAIPFRRAEERRRATEERVSELAAIVETTDDAVLGESVDGIIRTWNRGARELFGYEAHEIVGSHISRLIPPDSVEEVSSIKAKVAAGEHVRHFETERVRKDGSRVAVSLTLSPIRDAADRITGVSAIYRDITERKRAEEEIKYRADLTQTITENATSAFLLLDAEGRLTYMNSAAEAMSGWRLDEVRGTRAHDFIHWKYPDGRPFPIEECPIDNAYWNLRPVKRHEDIFVRRDGSLFPVTCAIAPLERDGETVGAVLEVRDVTEEKRAEEEIRALHAGLEEKVRERTRELAAANRELEAFSYSVSHDIRAPLRGIDYFSQVLEEDHAEQLDAEAREHVRRVRAESSRLSRLVSDILALANASRGEMRRERVDLTAMAHDIVQDLRQAHPHRNVTFRGGDGAEAQGDPRLLRLVLENLLGNAWKYSGREPDAIIEFGVRQEDDRRVFYVRDNGAGFDPAEAHRLFESFQRLHGNEFEGTGVGLATVKRIVERHGGDVWAQGRPGEGATISFTLP